VVQANTAAFSPASTSRLGAMTWGPNGPIRNPMSAGRVAAPAVDAALCRPMARSAQASPTRSLVVSVSNGDIGAAENPSRTMPPTGASPGKINRVAPMPMPARHALRIGCGPVRVATSPMTTRPRRRAIQYPEVVAAAASGGTTRAVVRKVYAQSAVPASTPVCTANTEAPDQTPTGGRLVRGGGVFQGDERDCGCWTAGHRLVVHANT